VPIDAFHATFKHAKIALCGAFICFAIGLFAALGAILASYFAQGWFFGQKNSGLRSMLAKRLK
jgi:hypothetical protein